MKCYDPNRQRSDKLRKYSKEQADLQKTVDVYRDYKSKKKK